MTKKEYIEDLNRIKNNMDSIIYLIEDLAGESGPEIEERAMNTADELLRISAHRIVCLMGNTHLDD